MLNAQADARSGALPLLRCLFKCGKPEITAPASIQPFLQNTPQNGKQTAGPHTDDTAMPLHVEPLPPGSKLVRAYSPGVDADDAYASMDSFVGVCVVTCVAGIARVVGALSRWQHPVRRQDIVAMVAIARGIGARELRIKRAPGHVMPRPFALVGDEWVLKLTE